MMNIEPINIKYKSVINKIGTSLILARRAIVQENFMLTLSSEQFLKLVLLGCLYVEMLQCKDSVSLINVDDAQAFARISNEITMQTTERWVQEYLHLTTDEMRLLRYGLPLKHLLEHVNNPLFGYLLPYALEMLEYSEQDLVNAHFDKRLGVVTNKKKKHGIYYTPADVASYMVESCVGHLIKEHNSSLNCRFMDFSCGSGIFLLHVIESIFHRENLELFEDYVFCVNSCIFGMDISHHAIDCAHYVIIAHSVRKYQNKKIDIASLLCALKKNIVCTDATKLPKFFRHHPTFPRTFECIIGNPPYVGGLNIERSDLQTDPRSNLFIPFVSNLIDYSSDNSICALVLPLSFSYNTQLGFINLRKIIENDDAIWQVEHYDRSPDSLFGDDVKSRNCIVFRKRSNGVRYKMSVTGLLRWTSLSRAQFLPSPKNMTDITNLSISNYIPKLGGEIEKKAFSKLINHECSIIRLLKTHSSENKPKVVIKGTAYNWICAYDHIPPSYDKDGNKYVSKDLKVYETQTEDDLYFVLAALNSTVAFWLWTVVCDGFHVTNGFLSAFRINKARFTHQQYLAMISLGKEFSTRIKQYPSQSVNSGKTIISYDHRPLQDIILEINLLMTIVLDLPDDFSGYLQKWYQNIVSCGRLPKKRVKSELSGGEK